jgi:unsaturated chondroitin disaccharide hydrolase
VVFDSFGNGARLTGNPSYQPILLQAAETLASRFLKQTGMIRSWGRIDDMEQFTVIMDNMMNLELLIWAAALFRPSPGHFTRPDIAAVFLG